ncbi:uncharacterized protein LOC133903503 [Phragmites australis]|uniref:uncharacterized protein LOC133903503 n=1 Tax=Phragmites australis TaxID=29695 RepID=UPI002D77903F|nr:uncharacterized protein LOC133903503 [Phragmites australis]
MASSALRRSLPLRGVSLRRALPSHPPPAAAVAAGGSFRRSFQSGDGETMDEFEERLFGNKGMDEGSLYAKLDRVGNTGRRYGMGSGMGGFGGFGDRSSSGSMGGFDSLNDGMSEMLGNTARRFQMDDDDEDDWEDEEFEFRPDVQYRRGSMYNVRDLDLKRPAVAKNPPRPQFETSTKEVLRKADFRNVRFLSNFLTEAGIIIKRSQTRISAKAQRKVAREIKTARAFGLMPFTTMGRRPFIFGRSAEERLSDEEYEYNFVEQKDGDPEEGNGDAEPAVETA